MSSTGLFFVGAGLLFVFRPGAAARYPYNSTGNSPTGPEEDNHQLIRYVLAPILIGLGIAILFGIMAP